MVVEFAQFVWGFVGEGVLVLDIFFVENLISPQSFVWGGEGGQSAFFLFVWQFLFFFLFFLELL